MTLRMLWPLWAMIAVFVPLLVLCVWQLRASRGERRLDWVRRTAMVACVAVIGLCPAIPSTENDGLVSNAELYFVVDRTGSMAAEDWNGSEPRLHGVANDMVALTQELPGSRYAIIAFDSQSTRQLPLTTDSRAVRSWADTVHQEITAYSAGSSIDRPLDQLRTTLEAAEERNPSNVRLVFFMSDGENTNGSNSDAGDGFASFADLAPLIDGGAVLGYGTAEGGRMRSYDGTDSSGYGTDAPYITDEGGADAISRIDETALRTVADQLGVQYSHRIAPDDLGALVEDIDLQAIADDGRRDLTTYTDVYWPAAVLLGLLLAWEAWNLSREVPKRKRDSEPQRRDRHRAMAMSGKGG
ncbi:vWA domain-containing protein [Pseudactinotalea terrae]|uniref:vWA domain-containing protein n=1 Tax=Pseudactinotalea terrae TaxID=1743262 RepID=UPI0012E1219F|nr:vWA domain-containing protein [Pseudactinotalea terrae]